MLLNKKSEEEVEFSGKQQILSFSFLPEFSANESLQLSPMNFRDVGDSLLGAEVFSNVTQTNDHMKYTPSQSTIAWIEETRILSDFADMKTSPSKKFDFEKTGNERTSYQKLKTLRNMRNIDITNVKNDVFLFKLFFFINDK